MFKCSGGLISIVILILCVSLYADTTAKKENLAAVPVERTDWSKPVTKMCTSCQMRFPPESATP